MLFLIPLLPLVGFLLNASLGSRMPKKAAGWVACLAMLGSFGLSVAAVRSLLAMPPDERDVVQNVFLWFGSGNLQAPFALRLDPLSALMILVVTGIGFLIHVYSVAYMHEERASEYARYFSYLNLFAAFMLVLVLGANFLVMFVGWEGVGLCSYLLIGFWFTKQSAADAGKKAFIVNRVGDFGFLLGMFLVFVQFDTLDFHRVAQAASSLPVETSVGALSIITILLFVGATGKSAQIPLYVWLPDAMEGPTPVSALIHAATMVTAGVYMIGRNAVLFSHTPSVLLVVAIVGTLTALMAGTIGLVQHDIKRVLAYSTVSQLGFMFLAMGVGAFAAGIFHLFTHAFFKALLFLGSGAVIHALAGQQDLRRMGGLRRELPVTYWTFLIGALAIAGVPGLAGFFSKDEILSRTFATGHRWLWAIGVTTSLLTAIYMFRLVFLAFHGEARAEALAHDETPGHGSRKPEAGSHLHDAPPAMAIPLIVLALGSILAGYVGVPHALGGANRIEQFLEPSFAAPAAERSAVVATRELPKSGAESGRETEELALMGVSIVVALGGIGVAAYFFLKRRAVATALAARFPSVYRIVLNKYYVDEIYDETIVQPVQRTSENVLSKGIDVRLIDAVVNGAGTWVSAMSGVLRYVQTGSVRAYAASFFLGVLAILSYYLWR